MRPNPENLRILAQKTTEIGGTIWNYVIPRNLPLPQVVILHSILDAGFITAIAKINNTNDLIDAALLGAAAISLHYERRKQSGDWRLNRG